MILSCFKQLPSNFTLVLTPIQFNEGARLLLDVTGGLILSSENPLDFQAKICSVLSIFLKYLYTG